MQEQTFQHVAFLNALCARCEPNYWEAINKYPVGSIKRQVQCEGLLARPR